MTRQTREELLAAKSRYYHENRKRILAEAAVPVHCEACDKWITKAKFNTHLQTGRHLEKVNGKPEVTEKVCPKCQVMQPIDNYHKANDKSDGRQSLCKSCRSIAAHAKLEETRVDCKACNITIPESLLEKHNATRKHHENVYGRPVKTKKCCITCKVEQPMKNFYELARARDGRLGECKTCRTAAQRKQHDKVVKAAQVSIMPRKLGSDCGLYTLF